MGRVTLIIAVIVILVVVVTAVGTYVAYCRHWLRSLPARIRSYHGTLPDSESDDNGVVSQTLLLEPSTLPSWMYTASLHQPSVAVVDKGTTRLAQSRLVFLGVMRDVEPILDHTLERWVHLGSNAKEAHYFVHESYSKDDTWSLLRAWAAADADHRHISTGSSTPDTARDRYQRICRARQQVVRDWRASGVVADFVVVADADLVGGCTLDGFKACFACADQWDMVWPRGYSLESFHGPYRWFSRWISKPGMYDTVAYKQTEADRRHLRPEVERYAMRHPMHTYVMEYEEHDLVPVFSAFGGMGIYRGDAHMDYGDAHGICEHVTLHTRLVTEFGFRGFIHKGWIVVR